MTPSAHFLLGRTPGKASGSYPHSAVLLAEGLKEFGWKISSDLPGWQTNLEGDLLFPGGGDEMLDAANLTVFADDFFLLQGSDCIPKKPFNRNAPKILLEKTDLLPTSAWIYGKSFRSLDRIFKCHSSSYFKYPPNVRPSVFGISNRIAMACAPVENARRSSALWDFAGGPFQHSVRRIAQRKVLPMIASKLPISSRRDSGSESDTPIGQLMRRQTDGRHFGSYYDRLRESAACACFGGWYLVPCQQKEGGRFCLWTRKILRRLPISTAVIGQWDSWRLWEAFAAGAAVLHVDFMRHGFLLGGPPPEAMKHYIPVDVKNPAKTLRQFLEQPSELLRIGEAGQKWAMENYSSRPIAARILADLGFKSGIARSEGPAENSVSRRRKKEECLLEALRTRNCGM